MCTHPDFKSFLLFFFFFSFNNRLGTELCTVLLASHFPAGTGLPSTAMAPRSSPGGDRKRLKEIAGCDSHFSSPYFQNIPNPAVKRGHSARPCPLQRSPPGRGRHCHAAASGGGGRSAGPSPLYQGSAAPGVPSGLFWAGGTEAARPVRCTHIARRARQPHTNPIPTGCDGEI